MSKTRLVIIGGSAAGIQAAISAKRLHGSELERIIVIRREPEVPVPCGIPYIYGTLGAVELNIVPDAILGDAELIIGNATSIDREAKTVTVDGGTVVRYDKLILATGSRGAAPPIPGSDLKNVFTIEKDPVYLGEVRHALEESSDLVIIGCGFIGLEFAEQCQKRGMNVTIVEMMEHCLALNADEEFCTPAEDELKRHGVKIIPNKMVRCIGGQKKAEYVELVTRERLKADIVILAIGIAINNELAKEADLEIGETRGIRVDEYQRTSDPAIFAAGDCAEKYSFFTKKPIGLRLASIATTEARIAASNLFEPKVKNPGIIGVFATSVGGVAVGASGLTEKTAKDAGFEVVIGDTITVDRHPGTMPGARESRLKLIFDKKSRKAIGGEVYGGLSTAELANGMSAAVTSGMTVDQLAVFQMGTHPVLTASPIAYQLVNAAEIALTKF